MKTHVFFELKEEREGNDTNVNGVERQLHLPLFFFSKESKVKIN